MPRRSRQQGGEFEVRCSLFSSLGPSLLVGELDVLETLGHGGVRLVQVGVVADSAAGTGRRQCPGG